MWLRVMASPASILDRAEALQGLASAPAAPGHVTRRARRPRQVVEGVANPLGAGEAMEGEDRLLQVQARATPRPVIQQAQPEGHDLEEGRLVVGQAFEDREGLGDRCARLLAIGAVPRRHGRACWTLMASGAPLAEALRRGLRVAEQPRRQRAKKLTDCSNIACC